MCAAGANRIFVGFINGKLIDSAIIGVLCFILCLLVRIPYPMLISVVVGVTNIIPFFGPIIGAIPCLMILVIVDPWAALRFFVLVIGLQQFDGNILGPKILGDSTGLSAIWVLVSIVVCGGLFGFPGMVLGVPTFAVLYTLVRDWANSRLRRKGLDGNGRPLPAPGAGRRTRRRSTPRKKFITTEGREAMASRPSVSVWIMPPGFGAALPPPWPFGAPPGGGRRAHTGAGGGNLRPSRPGSGPP